MLREIQYSSSTTFYCTIHFLSSNLSIKVNFYLNIIIIMRIFLFLSHRKYIYIYILLFRVSPLYLCLSYILEEE